VFVHAAGVTPDFLAGRLATLAHQPRPAGFQLQMITNRASRSGRRIPETFCTDHWRCRFVGVDMDQQPRAVTNRDIIDLLHNLESDGLDFIKTENLCTFDGRGRLRARPGPVGAARRRLVTIPPQDAPRLPARFSHVTMPDRRSTAGIHACQQPQPGAPVPIGHGHGGSRGQRPDGQLQPAGIARFAQRAVDADLLWFTSESQWESEFSGTGSRFDTKNSVTPSCPGSRSSSPSTTDSPRRSPSSHGLLRRSRRLARPLLHCKLRLRLRQRFPSLAYRIDDRWSAAASAAITYSSFEQERAVRNLFDPGFGDGRSRLEADSVEVGFGLSMLYQSSERTRWGLAYRSEINPAPEC